MRMRGAALTCGLSLFGFGAAAIAGPEPQLLVLTLHEHRFEPSRVTVVAGRPIRIEIVNRDAASEEFDSADLGIERDVTPNGRASFTVGPLKPGTYSFMGELHAATATGEITAVADR
jgi:plastocyanin